MRPLGIYRYGATKTCTYVAPGCAFNFEKKQYMLAIVCVIQYYVFSNMIDKMLQNQLLEMRRGNIVLVVLATLRGRAYYGYELLSALKNAGVAVDGSTLYPLLRRLDEQGLLKSEWNTTDSRPRKYYSITPNGRELFRLIRKEWVGMQADISKIINEE